MGSVIYRSVRMARRLQGVQTKQFFLWDIETGVVKLTLTGHTYSVNSVSLVRMAQHSQAGVATKRYVCGTLRGRHSQSDTQGSYGCGQ